MNDFFLQRSSRISDMQNRLSTSLGFNTYSNLLSLECIILLLNVSKCLLRWLQKILRTFLVFGNNINCVEAPHFQTLLSPTIFFVFQATKSPCLNRANHISHVDSSVFEILEQCNNNQVTPFLGKLHKNSYRPNI